MAVDIKIDLKTGSAHTKINLLKGHLKQLENVSDDLDFDVEIGDAASEIQDLVAALEDAEKSMGRLTSNITEAAHALDGAEIGVSAIDSPDGRTGAVGGEADPPAATSGGTEGMSTREFTRRMDSLFGTRQGIFQTPGQLDLSDTEGSGSFRNPFTGEYSSGIDPLKDERRVGTDVGFGTEPLSMARKRRSMLDAGELEDIANLDIGGFDFGGDNDSLRRLKERLEGLEMESINRGFGKFGRTLKRLQPSMRQWWSLLAAIIPLIIAFGVQALGVAAAMGAVATAGAAVIGLGLVGHGDSMAESWANAKEQLSELKSELFEVFQPTAQAFAPITDEFLDIAPGELTGVADALEGLTAYEDTIFKVFSGLTEWLEEAIGGLVTAEDTVSQLTLRFGDILGTGIINFFGWLLRMADENQDMLIDLGAVLASIGRIIINVSNVVGGLVAAMRPLFEFIEGLTRLLDNQLIMSFIAFIAFAGLAAFTIGKVTLAAYSLITAISGLVGWLSLLGGGSLLAGITTFFTTLGSYITATIIALWEMYGAAVAAATALAMTGVGLAVVGAGALGAAAVADNMGGGGGGGRRRSPSGGQTVVNNYNSYQVTHQGEMSTDSEQRIRSTIRDVQSEDGAAAPPSVDTGTSSSSTQEGS